MVPFPFHHNRPFFPSNTTSSSPALGGEGRKSRRDVATAVRESAAAHLPRRPSVKPRSQTSLRRTRGSASTLDLPAPARRAGLVNHKLVPHGFGSQPGVLQKVPWSPCHTGQRGGTRCLQSASLLVGPGPCACGQREGHVVLVGNRPREHGLR